jgi:hypothetical protein
VSDENRDSHIMWQVTVFAILTVMPIVESTGKVPAPAPVQTTILEHEALAAVPRSGIVLDGPAPQATVDDHAICRVGYIVMIPDGREARVTSHGDGICSVLAYGEGYASLWPDDIVEPVYPQLLPVREFGH